MSQDHGEAHLPHGSVWPFWMTLAIAIVGLGIVFLKTAPVIVLAGLVFLVLMLLGWVREDYNWWKTNTGTGPHMLKAGTLMFISSEIFIFGALFATYFTFQRLNLHHWPDAEVHLPVPLVLLFSVFLFASSFTIHQAEKAIKKDDLKGFNKWWGITILLGLVFLAGQINEYVELITHGHTLGSSQFISSFYMLTGTHGLHVFGGLCVLTFIWVRGLKGQFNSTRHDGPEAAAMYWHFVDIVWIVVLLVIYVVPWLQGAYSH